MYPDLQKNSNFYINIHYQQLKYIRNVWAKCEKLALPELTVEERKLRPALGNPYKTIQSKGDYPIEEPTKMH